MCLTAGLRAEAQTSFAGVAQTHPWQMKNATPARTGQSESVGATLGQVAWRFPVAGNVPQMAVAQDGTIYLGTVFNQNDWNNESYAYALTGAGNVLIPSTYTQLLKLTSEGDSVWTYPAAA